MDCGQKNKGPRACVTCAKAKARCISGPKGSNKCERCHRLRKPCGSQTPAPPRPKKDARPTKVAELEKRLNELTTQLGATQGNASATSPPTAVGSADSPLPPSNSIKPASAKIPINCDHLFPPDDVLAGDDAETGASVPLPTPGSSTADDHPTVSSRGWSQSDVRGESPWPLNNEQSIILQTFVDEMQPLYPFVIVPPNMGPAQLAAERPYLWKGIQMMACHLDAAKQVRLGNELLQDIVQAAFMKPVKSLDVLQGLQLLIAWYNYNINSYQLTNLLFLARSMCISLGSKDNPIKLKRRGKGNCYMGDISVQNQDVDSKAEPQTRESASARLELMRAFVGCYYLNTLVFTTNKRPDAFMNSAHLESCCRQIEEAGEYPTDQLLVQLFKIQQLTQAISLTLGAESKSFQSQQLPLTMAVQSFQQQLDIFKSSLPAHLKDNLVLLTHVSIAEILLYEIGIPECQGSASFISLTERLELLWRCCGAAKTFLDLRFPRNNLSVQPLVICLSASDFIYVFILCLKLMTLEVPGWDLQLIKKHLDLAGVVDGYVALLDIYVAHRNKRPAGAVGTDPAVLSTDVPGQNVVDPFIRLTCMLRYFKELIRGELSGSRSQLTTQGPMQLPASLSDSTQAMIWDLDADFWSGMPDDELGKWDVGAVFPAMDWTAT
ncbi:uncharacterized protein GLRG_03760 [Colletotrichum graminicola M1.001]|uniref:Zn(2)-C6 fungal-type domain-containing protein n=1 Tax=Colletotrichum graminicola (strain M1.001 / M2 / FGSC 10212) TaxID=645133 RepID=E3QCM8_COLGM|nr:uncharacterized protein GLRG_03760 [Colletotrichum graminicola M1.001]EFQ28616.1 hypothetical protein GLRG_03760 [Colletotrichum graminicola M1.001]